MLKSKLRAVGNSDGLLIPKEVLHDLNVQRGDEVCFTKAADGSYNISAYDPEFEEQMLAMEVIGRQYRNTLKELAK